MLKAGHDLINAQEATRILDIKPATLYAYVSRGLVRSYAKDGEKAKHYNRQDIERLKARHSARSGHGAVAAGALRWGEPVLDSSITRIDEQGPHYRGYAAVSLADRGVYFENVCELLWTGLLPETNIVWPAVNSTIDPKTLRQSPLRAQNPNAFVSRLLSYMVSLYALLNEDQTADLSHNLTAHARDLMHLIAGHLFLLRKGGRPDSQNTDMKIAERIANALLTRPSQQASRLINTGLILSADHELTPSTFAARVAASTGADLFSCLTSAAGALAGPRHGGVFEELENIQCKLQSESVTNILRNIRKRGDQLPGFAHSLYENMDPRAQLLIDQIQQQSFQGEAYERWLEFTSTATKQGFGFPSIDTALLLLASGLGLPSGSAGSIFAIGRMAGWTAHIIEQRLSGFMVRPRARYIGR